MAGRVFPPLRVYFFWIVFFAGMSMCLVIYAILSPYWFLVNPREYSHVQVTRVIGLWELLEGQDKENMESLLSNPAFEVQERFNLGWRRDRVCSEASSEFDLTERDGLDVEDMRLLGEIRVPCKHGGYYGEKSRSIGALPIPIPPAPRLTVGKGENLHRLRPQQSTASMILNQGCGKPSKCPVGFRDCKHPTRTCYDKKWGNVKEDACCVKNPDEKNALGSTLYSNSRTPGYVQIFGWAKWQVRSLLEDDDPTRRWCSVRELRCQFLSDLEMIGGRYGLCLITAACLLGCITGFGLCRCREWFAVPIFVIFIIAGVLTVFAVWGFEADMARLLKLNMTRRDQWGRPYIHPMKNYDGGGRSIVKGWEEKFPKAAAEWVYYHLNARVDFGTYDKDCPQGYRELWAVTLGQVSAGAAAIGAVISFELLFVMYLKTCPIQRLCEIILGILFFPLAKLKWFVDTWIAAYPVLWIYPWQKLYPNSFPAGMWLGSPMDQIWEFTVGLFGHLVRAIWDYPTCQDICSPSEKEVLGKLGIMNDRLRSLLCSRRSYFVLMALLGVLNFAADLLELLHISNKQTHFQQAANTHDNYPRYFCNFRTGLCPIETPDLEVYGNYTADMLLKLYSIAELGCNSNESLQQLVEWLGGFISVTCACAALHYWTNFAKSRKFCLMGWIAMMLTPAVTSSFSANYRLDWQKEEEAMVNSIAELWEDMSLWLATQPCETMAETTDKSLGKMTYICRWVKSLKYVVPTDVLEGCKKFNVWDDWAKKKLVMQNITEVCRKSAQYWQDGPQTRQEFEDHVRKKVPAMMLGLRMLVGLRAGVQNILRILPAVISMVPALLQAALMLKNMVPRQTMPSILTTLPWAYTLVFWAQYQIYYQFMDRWMFLVALLAMSFAQMFYYIFSKYYHLHQPMCDQQSVTLTFRIWYYCAMAAFVTPYIVTWIFLGWFNDFLTDKVWFNTIGWILDPTMRDMIKFISGGIMSYTYTIQAGVDWFVDELVQHHLASHAPLVLAASNSPEEFRMLQKRLGTDIDVDLIETGTYVCGGLGDANRLDPPKEGDWRYKAKMYSCSLALKDFSTLDAFSEHIFQDNGLTQILNAGRRPWYAWMQDGSFGAQSNGGRSCAAGNGRHQARPTWGTDFRNQQYHAHGAVELQSRHTNHHILAGVDQVHAARQQQQQQYGQTGSHPQSVHAGFQSHTGFQSHIGYSTQSVHAGFGQNASQQPAWHATPLLPPRH